MKGIEPLWLRSLAVTVMLGSAAVHAESGAGSTEAPLGVLPDSSTEAVDKPRVLDEVEKRATRQPFDEQTGVGTLDSDPLLRPLSLQTVDIERFRQGGGRNVADVQDFLPGVYSSSGDSEFRLDDGLSIRGFENLYVLVNGVRHLRVDTGAIGLANIERIEIIKGAAGLEVGTVEPGGGLNLVTLKPEAVAATRVELEAGGFERAGLLLDTTGPLSDRFRGRVIAAASRGGQLRELPADELLLAPSLAWSPTADSHWLLETHAAYSDHGYDTGGFYLKGAGLDNDFAPRAFSYQNDDNHNRNRELRAALYGRQQLATNTELRLNTSLEGRSTATRGFLAFPDSLYEGGSDNSLDYSGDPVIDRTRFERHNRGQRGLAGQLMLLHTLAFERHRHKFGVGVQTSEDRFEQQLRFGERFQSQNVLAPDQSFPETGPPSDPDSGGGLPLPIPGEEQTGSPSPAESLFGAVIKQRSGILQYIGDAGRWHWLAGIRRDRTGYKVAFEDDPEEGRSNESFGSETNSLRAGLSYRLAPPWVLYTSLSSAYLPQGGITREGTPLRPSRARSGELGLRFRQAGDLLELNLFHIRQDQFAQPDPVNNPFGLFQLNTGELRSRGAELLTSLELPGARRLGLNASYLDAKIVASEEGLAGARQPNVPYASASLRLYQGLAALGLADTGIELAVHYVGERRPSLFYQYDPDYRLPAYTRLDLFVEHRLGPRTSLGLQARNVLDQRYIESAGAAPFYNFAGEPLGVLLTWRHRLN